MRGFALLAVATAALALSGCAGTSLWGDPGATGAAPLANLTIGGTVTIPNIAPASGVVIGMAPQPVASVTTVAPATVSVAPATTVIRTREK